MKLELGEAAALLEATGRIELELRSHGIGGSDGAMIDHIELSGPPVRDDADSRNFVRCPGGEYDRSPCGTGTSAKLAVLHSRGLLESGQEYRQESITGSLFTAKLVPRDGNLVPLVSGRAFITAESTLLFDSSDPFRYGLPDQ
jgi:4-hydroxyproline epimerase